MGISPRLALYARHCDGPDRLDDPTEAPGIQHRHRRAAFAGLIAAFATIASAALSDTLRVATFNTELARDGPGLFLHDILGGESPDIEEAATRIARSGADIILLQGIDYDFDQTALAAFAARVTSHGQTYPHLFALKPNSGQQSGLDLDQNGRLGEPRDAQGYGAFTGQGGMAILSRHPVNRHTDLTDMLWRNLPATSISPSDPGFDIQRLSSVGHWIVELAPANMPPVTIMAFHATPPVFDGPEDRNGRRNHDEAAIWSHFLDGALKLAPPESGFILAGDANLDPVDGDGLPEALHALLTDPRLQDPAPRSDAASDASMAEGGANLGQMGDPGLDTANWRDEPGPGNLRVDYILPSSDWKVLDSGVLWPEPDPDLSEDALRTLSRHGLVWVDLKR